MTERNKGGTAFPQPINPSEQGRGMTLRDYFAAKAMQAFVSADPGGDRSAKSVAKEAYLMADAMLEARK